MDDETGIPRGDCVDSDNRAGPVKASFEQLSASFAPSFQTFKLSLPTPQSRRSFRAHRLGAVRAVRRSASHVPLSGRVLVSVRSALPVLRIRFARPGTRSLWGLSGWFRQHRHWHPALPVRPHQYSGHRFTHRALSGAPASHLRVDSPLLSHGLFGVLIGAPYKET